MDRYNDKDLVYFILLLCSLCDVRQYAWATFVFETGRDTMQLYIEIASRAIPLLPTLVEPQYCV